MPFENLLKDIFDKTENSNKMLHIVGDFNMNWPDYEKCKKVHEFLNLIYENSMVPTINKPTRVTRQSTTAIDRILKNCFVNFDFKGAIFKSDISDHFPISFFLPMINEFSKTEPIYVHKRIINSNAIEMFRQKLHETDWAEIETLRNPNVCYKIFLKRFMSFYDAHFPIKIIKLKTKDMQSPWITTATKKSSSNHKQRLYEKFSKTRCIKTENAYKNYKNLFEWIKKLAKRLHFSKLIIKYKNNIKMTWSVIKRCK